MQNSQKTVSPLKEDPLENLFSIVSPTQLRKSILEIFMNYLIRLDIKNIPNDFTMMSEDIYFLLQFLEEAERLRNKNME